MLAATYGTEKKHVQSFTYPVIGSPKVDGIRMLVVDGVCQSRSGKPIPCPTVQRLFGHLEGLDGELTIGSLTAQDLMQRTMRVMTKEELTEEETLDLSFNVFDYWPGGSFAYELRLEELHLQQASWARETYGRYTEGGVRILPHVIVESEEHLLALETELLAMGYEGLMINNPKAGYKHGRAGKTDWALVKVKRFVDNEAIIIGATEMMHNDNVAFKDELGKTKRATLQENMRPAGVLGSLRLRVLNGTFTDVEFDCSGFTADQRHELWQLYLSGGLVGLVGTFKHFEVTGAKDKPRQPVWKGLRAREDL